MKLYEIPEDSDIHVTLENGSVDVFKFKHLDGMYSLCVNDAGQLLHLSGYTPLIKIKDHYEICEKAS